MYKDNENNMLVFLLKYLGSCLKVFNITWKNYYHLSSNYYNLKRMGALTKNKILNIYKNF